MPNAVTADQCHEFRKEIFGAIFPRWALVIALGVIVGSMGTVYLLLMNARDETAVVTKKNELLEQRFTMTVDYIKESQKEIKAEQKEQRALLQKIDRRLNGVR